MNRKAGKALVLGFAIVIGLSTLVLATESRRCPQFPKRLMRALLLQSYVPSADVSFKWQMSASGNTPDGGRFDDSLYLSTDCVKVNVTYYSFPSTATAERRFDSSLQAARVVYAKSVQPDTEEKPYDQRIVLAAQANGLYDILHRNGNRLLQIESSSLSHALEYEKRLGIHVTVDVEPSRR